MRGVDVFVCVLEVLVFMVPRSVRVVEVPLFVEVFVRVGAVCLAVSKFEIVFVKSAVSADAVLFGAAAVDTFDTLLL